MYCETNDNSTRPYVGTWAIWPAVAPVFFKIKTQNETSQFEQNSSGLSLNVSIKLFSKAKSAFWLVCKVETGA